MRKLSGREVAVKALLRVQEDDAYSNIVLDRLLQQASLDAREAALASALFYGVLEKQIALDYLLSGFLRGKRPDTLVEAVLRCAVYQLFFMDKIPANAAVNEAVELTKRLRNQGAAGFVNGVLRALLRGKENLVSPKDPMEAKSVEYSVPVWLLAHWERSYGVGILQGILESLCQKAPFYIRVNTLRTQREALLARLQQEGVLARPVLLEEAAAELVQPGHVVRLPAFQEGLFHVQDLASQLACRALAPRPGAVLYDLCAAPGGKTFTLAQRMEDRGIVNASDLYEGKLRLLADGARRLGISCVRTSVRDARSEAKMPLADYVLCDAPCSGLGILRRKPEIRYKPQSLLDGLPGLQFEILSSGARLVKPGGKLLYATCTLNPAENGEIADRFLKENPAFAPVPLGLPVQSLWGEPAHQLTLFPQMQNTDGFFMALFQRREAAE